MDRPDFSAMAEAITLAAGRAAHGATPIRTVAEQLAVDLAAAWPAEHHEPAPLAPVGLSDTPLHHLAWASHLLGQMSRQRLDSGQNYAIEEALGHLRRVAELMADELWADAPAFEDDEEPGQR